MPNRVQIANYLEQAERCRRTAAEMSNSAMAAKLVDIAQTYETLARQLQWLQARAQMNAPDRQDGQ